ncbi:helix-turn-helix domain-containing protein [Nocardiopsis nanhaiensis]
MTGISRGRGSPKTTPIGHALRDRRQQIALTQSALAYLASLTRGTVRNVEANSVTPGERAIGSIAVVLGLNPVKAQSDRTLDPVLSAGIVRIITGLILDGDHPDEKYPHDNGRIAQEMGVYENLVRTLADRGEPDEATVPDANELASMILPRIRKPVDKTAVATWLGHLGVDEGSIRTVAPAPPDCPNRGPDNPHTMTVMVSVAPCDAGEFKQMAKARRIVHTNDKETLIKTLRQIADEIEGGDP